MMMRILLALALLAISLGSAGVKAQQPAAIKTGPEIGEKIPAFEATDQKGTSQTFQSIRGPRGAVITFFRSADW
jgi:cytochrome oxidase Cu insertion factor (SCO1/SenC/PrrC family)